MSNPNAVEAQINAVPWTNGKGMVTGATVSALLLSIVALFNNYAPLASPTFTGTLTTPTLAVSGSASVAGAASVGSLASSGGITGTNITGSGTVTGGSFSLPGCTGWVYDSGSGNLTCQPGSGDVVRAANGVATIQPNVVTYAKSAQASANTVVGNPTSATANKQDMPMPSCTGGTSALQWTANSGFGCNTGLGPIAGYKNRVINGNFRVDQWTAGASFTSTVSTGLYGFLDRWYVSSAGAGVALVQVAGTAPNLNALQITGASSNTGVVIGQRIESYNIADLEGTTVTLQAQLSCSLVTTATWTAYYPPTQDNWATRQQFATGTFAIGASPAVVTAQMALPLYVQQGMEIEFNFGAMASSSSTCLVQNVQLEAGSAATTFEAIPYQIELAMCQRYYYKIGGLNYVYGIGWSPTTTAVRGYVQFPVTLRTASFTAGSSAGSTFTFGGQPGGSTPTFPNQTPAGLQINIISSGQTAGNVGTVIDTGSGTSYISANAEL